LPQVLAETQKEKNLSGQKQWGIEDLEEVVGQCRAPTLDRMAKKLDDPAEHERAEEDRD
jgi:hypothetical protein